MHILLLRQEGTDLHGLGKAHLLGADDVPGDRVAHIDAHFRLCLHLPQGDPEDLRMGFAITGDAGDRYILHKAADAVVLQHAEHIVQRGVVGDNAQVVAPALQGLQHLCRAVAELPVVEGDLPQVGQLLGDGQQLFPVKGKVPKIPVRPNLLRLFLQHIPLAPLLIGLYAVRDPLPEHIVRAAGLQAVGPQDLQQPAAGRPLGVLVVPNILQSSAHIK